MNFSQVNNIHNFSLASSEEGVNIIISNDPLQRFSWMILLNDSLVAPSGCWLSVWRFSNINVVSSCKEFEVYRSVAGPPRGLPWFVLLWKQCLCKWEKYDTWFIRIACLKALLKGPTALQLAPSGLGSIEELIFNSFFKSTSFFRW